MKRSFVCVLGAGLVMSIAAFGGDAFAQVLQTWTCYDASSNKTCEYTYYVTNGVEIKHGRSTSWTSAGDIIQDGYYSHDKKTGLWQDNSAAPWSFTEVYDDGFLLQKRVFNYLTNLVSHSEYIPGGIIPIYNQQIQYYTEYFAGPDTDIPEWIVTDVSPSGTWEDLRRLDEFYYQSGKLHVTRQFAYYANKSPRLGKTGMQSEGVHRTFYENGQLQDEFFYLEGEKHGLARVWCEDGTLAKSWPCRLGKTHGKYQVWRCDGSLYQIHTYDDGVLHGYYEQRGNIFEDDGYADIGEYSHGVRCGVWLSYKPSGAIFTNYYGNCDPVAPVDSPPPPNPGSSDNPNKSISGKVFNRDTGAPLHNVSVSAGGETTSTDTNGQYQIMVGNRDEVAVEVLNNGFRPWVGLTSLADAQSAVLNVELIPIAGDSGVTDVKSANGTIFLAGISASNEYTAIVDWGGSDPGTVVFKANDVEQTVPASGNKAAISYDMGSAFKATINPLGNTLRVVSQNVAGDLSPSSFVLNPIVLPLPGWSASLGIFTYDMSSGKPVYKLKIDYPKEPVEIQISEKALGSTLWTAWALVPIIGGQEMGIPPTQFNFEAELSTEGKGNVGIGGNMGFKVAGAEIKTKVAGKGFLEYDRVGNEGIMWKTAEVGGGLEGTVKREYGPVTVIPALAGAVSLPLVGRPIAWFNGRAKIDAAVKVGGDLKFLLINGTNGIVFDSTEGALSSGVELGLGGDLGPVKARIGGGGGSKFTYQFPAKPNYLKSAEVEVTAKLKLELWSYESEFEAKGTLQYPEGGVATKSSLHNDIVSSFHPLDTSFASAEPYNRFRPEFLSGRKALSRSGSPFIANVFPYSAPAFSARGTNHAVVYVSYDTNKPVAQGNELWASFLRNGQWSVPTAFTQDTRNDFSPSISYAANDRLVAVWERVRPADFAGETPESIAGELEIAYAVYNPATTTWSAPAFLTDNSILDFAPILTASPASELGVFWLQSPGNQLIGDSSTPLQLWYAAWNGSGFDPPVAHPYAFSNAFDFTYAVDGVRTRVAWIQDSDGDLATSTDQQLFFSAFDGAVWGAPVPLLPGDVPSTGPRLLCTDTNQWELFWQHGDELVRLTNWAAPATETIRSDSGGFAFANFQLSRADDGRFLLLWHGLEDDMPDLYGRVFDAAHATWSEDLRLTQDKNRETAVTGGLGSDGVIRLFFTQDRTNEPSLTDLYYLERPLGFNLAADSSNHVFSPETPQMNEEVALTAFVQNSGELSCTGVVASFYLGDPMDGGALISTVPVSPALLPAGATGTVTLASWLVPTNIGLRAVYIVFDSNGQIAESNESDNVAVLHPVWIDMAVTDIAVGEPRYGGDIDIVITLANLGNDVARNIPVACSIDDHSVGTLTLPAVLPGLTAQIGLTANSAVDFLVTRSTVSAEADPLQSLPDVDWSNNRLEVVVNRVQGRSSTGDGIDDDWKRKYFGHIEVSADDDPDEDGMPNDLEFRTGTDPLNPDSVFCAQQDIFNAFGTRQLSWPAHAGRNYTVDITFDLLNWLPLQANIRAITDGPMSVFDIHDAVTNRAFYRIRMVE